jgi:gamma-glutamyl hydrolase
VIPLRFDDSLDNLVKYAGYVDGILFTGGDADIKQGKYRDAGAALYNTAMKNNIPLWGTCLGFEFITVLTSGNNDILETVNAENISLPLTFTKDGLTSRLYSKASGDVIRSFTKEPFAVNEHSYGLSSAAFAYSQDLTSQVTVLSTNVDKDGKEFISSFEFNDKPVYGTQFHPEKNAFNWNCDAANHSNDAIVAMAYLATQFLLDCRAHNANFPSDDVLHSSLIYNTPLSYNATGYFELSYNFPSLLQRGDTPREYSEY